MSPGRAHTLLAIAGASSLVACSSSTDQDGGDREDSGDAISALSRFDRDPRFVLRDRIELRSGPVVLSEQPFCHRGRNWHVFPLTMFGKATLDVKLSVRDPAMADSAAVWVFGPQRADGSWPPARRAVSDGGTGSLSIAATERGHFAVVVGPSSDKQFRPRYPSFLIEELRDAEDEVFSAVLEPDGDDLVLELIDDGRRFKLVNPVTSRPPGTKVDPEEPIAVTPMSGGKPVLFFPEVWSRVGFWTKVDSTLGNSHLGVLGNEAADRFSIASTPRSRDGELIADLDKDYVVVDALGHDGSDSDFPVLIRAVEEPGGTDEISVIEDEACSAKLGRPCRIAIVDVGDGAPSEVPPESYELFMNTFVDFDEPSQYDLRIACSGVCTSASTATAATSGPTRLAAGPRPTRYPVYFAHGFASSRDAPLKVAAFLAQADSRWNGWTRAESVPPLEPVGARTEVLRRHLARFFADLKAAGATPPAGERFLRLNVIAHSMGGLDIRALVGLDKYNNAMCHVRLDCRADNGTAEPCCEADAAGGAIAWRARIVSITTLSSPHVGSSFATWLLDGISSDPIDAMARRAVKLMFGLESDAEVQSLFDTAVALGTNQCDPSSPGCGEGAATPRLPPPNPSRVYAWECAANGSCAADLPAKHLPQKSDAGPLLPPPDSIPTVFSWSGRACITGTCGAIIEPELVVPHGVVAEREGDNDGVVSVDSAQFGIFMGIEPVDHRGWHGELVGKSLFGHPRAGIGAWYQFWFDRLAAAGY